MMIVFGARHSDLARQRQQRHRHEPERHHEHDRGARFVAEPQQRADEREDDEEGRGERAGHGVIDRIRPIGIATKPETAPSRKDGAVACAITCDSWLVATASVTRSLS